ncbi:unnamed protein product [Sphagnum jensenii]|uniref:Uncharacterized protein n=1 Tax=Sphagnum jensenii TaxID=128206 RepID=A0ABP1AXE7_9BRYO
MSNKKHEQNIPSLPLATKLGASDAARPARRTHDHITLSDKKGLSPIERSTIHTLSSLITFSMPLDAQQHFSGGTK